MTWTQKARVAESSVSTGTGDFVLTGAYKAASETIATHRRFNAVCAVGDRGSYVIVADDGKWERGEFTYSAANTITRTTVLENSNGDTAAVNFAIGAKIVFLDMPTAYRALLNDSQFYRAVNRLAQGALTLYVSTTGSDTNDGLTTGTAFRTIQAAVHEAMTRTLHGAANTGITIQLADGTYTEAVIIMGRPAGSAYNNYSITIQGNSATPGNVIVTSSNSNGPIATVRTGDGADVYLTNFKIERTGVAGSWTHCFSVEGGSVGEVGPGMIFAGAPGGHMNVGAAATLYAYQPYTIAGSAGAHIVGWGQGHFEGGYSTITLTGTPNFSTSFVNADGGAFVYHGSATFSGAATGKRFIANMGAVIYTDGNGSSYFPGSLAGTTHLGGRYDTLSGFIVNTTIYVSPTGDDDKNAGLGPNFPVKTITRAMQIAMGTFAQNTKVTIQLADGTYTECVKAFGATPGMSSFGAILIQGNATTPANVIVTSGSTEGPVGTIRAYSGASIRCENFKVERTGTDTSSCCLSAEAGGIVEVGPGMIIGASPGAQISSGMGGMVWTYANYTIAAGAQIHIYAWNGGAHEGGANTVTLTGTPAFSQAFAMAEGGTIYQEGSTFVGSATGKRFWALQGGKFISYGGTPALTYFPGDADGTLGAGGRYGTFTSSTTSGNTVASLPSATGRSGWTYFVTDATSATFGSIVAGGGANKVPVYCDGTNWRVG